VAPSRDLCETLSALYVANQADTAQCLLDAGSLHDDAECAAVGALLCWGYRVSAAGHTARLVREMRAAFEAAGKKLINAA
jgi:hypothetical protein